MMSARINNCCILCVIDSDRKCKFIVFQPLFVLNRWLIHIININWLHELSATINVYNSYNNSNLQQNVGDRKPLKKTFS